MNTATEIQDLIESRINEAVREQVSSILEDVEQRREAERWNHIMRSVVSDIRVEQEARERQA